MRICLRRRAFLVAVGGAASAGVSLASRAQQSRQMRRIGVLARGGESDRVLQAQLAAMREGLAKQGWIEGRNVRFEIRLSEDDPDRLRAHADELVRLEPDVIFVGSLPATRVLLERSRTIPIVFYNVGDPVAGGLLKNIARPEGNATGITSLFQSLPAKWLELLKEAAPRTARVALVFVPGIVVENYFTTINAAAEVLAITTISIPYRNAGELERAVDTFAAESGGALVIVPPPPRGINSGLIRQLALKYRLPTITANKYDVADGLLMSYGGDSVEPARIGVSYIHRILQGAKISELPVQFPTKIELVINLKTAKAIGLDIPGTLIGRADEVIE